MLKQTQEKTYYIGVAAELVDCHPQTLRLDEKLGLMRPSRTGANVRLYSEADVERARQIKRLTGELGVNLAGVEIILHLLERVERLQHQVELLRGALEQFDQGLLPDVAEAMLGVDKVVARVEIPIVLDHRDVPACLPEDAQRVLLPERRPGGLLEYLHPDLADVLAHPLVEDGAQEIAPGHRGN